MQFSFQARLVFMEDDFIKVYNKMSIINDLQTLNIYRNIQENEK